MELEKTRSGLEAKFYDLVQEVLPSTGLSLYEMEYNTSNSTLVVFIIDPQTKSAVIEDCIKFDRAFSEPFEELDWIPENIRLEVSSPGVYRNLKRREHFEMSEGERISVTLKNKLDEGLDLPKKVLKSNKILGIVKEIKDKNIVLNIEDSQVEVSFENIKKANLEPEL
jgi:ribosome maturation factor RimP